MTLSSGARLGPYEVLGPLGAGGMGEVYRARDVRLGREVALKVLPAELSADSERLARFEREARSASALNHPHIVTVYDVGRAGALSYIAMELVDGRTLRELLADGPLSAKRAVAIAAQAADALAKAHSAGIVHRDLKPENVMVSKDGFVKILDFGLAKLVAPSPSGSGSLAPTAIDATRPGSVLGTVGYMSPEQARGTDVDFRSDQFSFGSILYEMAAGRRAFHGDSAPETMAAIIREEPESLGRTAPSGPAPYRWIVERCLQKDPEDRYASTRDLAREIADLRDHFSEIDRSATSVAPAPPALFRARRSPLSLAGIVLAAFAAGIAAAALWTSRRPAALPPALRALTYSGADQSPAVSPDGRTIAFTSRRDAKARIWIKQLATGGEAALTSGPGDDYPRFSPDGSALLFLRRDGNDTSIYRASLVGGEPRKLLSNAAQADWSPDGKQIAFLRWENVGGRNISIVGTAAADGTGSREIARVVSYQLVHPRWSPDGSTIATAEVGVAGAPRSVHLIDAKTGAARRVPSLILTGFLSSPVWTRSGKEVLYSQAESVVGNVTSSSARIIRQNVRTGKGESLLWIPSNALVLDVLGNGQLVFDASPVRENLHEVALGGGGAAESRWLTQGNASDRQPCYTPDGEWVVFSSNRSGNLDLWEVSRRTGAVRRLTDDRADDWDPGFTRDGKLIWSSNRTGAFEIWMAESDGSDARQVTREGMDAENPTATPDGRWIVYNQSFPQKAGLWKVHPDGTGNTQFVKGTTVLPDVSPDGQYVSYRSTLRIDQYDVKVARISDGAVTPLVRVNAVPQSIANSLGRTRWMPDGKAVAFIGQDQKAAYGVYVQDFVPGKNTSATRRPLAGFDSGIATESFGISPDGKHVTMAGWEQVFSLMVAERVPGIDSPRRPR